MHAENGESGRVQMLGDTALGQNYRVIGEVEVLPCGVTEIGSHDSDPTSGSEALKHLLEERGDGLLAGQMLEEVRDEDSAEIVAGQVGHHDFGHDQTQSVAGDALVIVDGVNRPALRGGNGSDELTAAG